MDDNFHYMDESERYKLGEFDDCASAAGACKRIVDEFLETTKSHCAPEDLLAQYTMFGEDPWISSADTNCKFSAWDYARERCQQITAKS